MSPLRGGLGRGAEGRSMNVLYLQKRPIRAGAQTSLARLVSSAPLRDLNPVVLVSELGWLETQLRRQRVPVIVSRFANSRTLTARLLGLRSWARGIVRTAASMELSVQAIVANDHQECPLALALACELGGAPVLAILRTPGMTRRDFDKYRCQRCDAILGEGTELRERVSRWTRKPVGLFEEGFGEWEFEALRPWPASCPRRLVVIGSESRRKGFTDFIEAVGRLESADPGFPGFDCDLTGKLNDEIAVLLRKPFRSRFKFLGRVEAFADLVRSYDLAVHPSRAESFGMAPIESLIAGTPTLVSVTGVVGELALPSAWTFPAADIAALAQRLAALWRDWPRLPMAEVQEHIRRRFHIDRTARNVRAHLEAVCAPRADSPRAR